MSMFVYPHDPKHGQKILVQNSKRFQAETGLDQRERFDENITGGDQVLFGLHQSAPGPRRQAVVAVIGVEHSQETRRVDEYAQLP